MRIRIAYIIFICLMLMLVGVVSACIPESTNEFESKPEDESEQWVLLQIKQPESIKPTHPLESVMIDKRNYAAVITLRYKTWHEFVFSVSAPANIGPGEIVSCLFAPTVIKNTPELTSVPHDTFFRALYTSPSANSSPILRYAKPPDYPDDEELPESLFPPSWRYGGTHYNDRQLYAIAWAPELESPPEPPFRAGPISWYDFVFSEDTPDNFTIELWVSGLGLVNVESQPLLEFVYGKAD